MRCRSSERVPRMRRVCWEAVDGDRTARLLRSGWTTLALAVVVALTSSAVSWPRAALARELLPPTTWTGTVSGKSEAAESIGTTTTMAANVRFDLEKPHPPGEYAYWATGSATYTISGGKDCTETGTSTFPITGDDGVLGITRHGARWKYEVDIVLRSAPPFIVHQTCPDASGDTDTYRSPVLYAGFKSRDVPPGLASLVGAYGQGTPEEWSWSFSGTPVKKKRHRHHHRH